jgi:hypothetical protein
LAWKLKPTLAAWLTPSMRAAADTVHATLRMRVLELGHSFFIVDYHRLLVFASFGQYKPKGFSKRLKNFSGCDALGRKLPEPGIWSRLFLMLSRAPLAYMFCPAGVHAPDS